MPDTFGGCKERRTGRTIRWASGSGIFGKGVRSTVITEEASTKMFKVGGRKRIVPSVAALLMVLLIVPVAHAGILWSGIDPKWAKKQEHEYT